MVNFDVWQEYTNKFGNDGLNLFTFDFDDEKQTDDLMKEMKRAIKRGKPIGEDFYNYPSGAVI